MLTSLTGAVPVPGSRTVTNEAVPSLLTHAVVFTRVTVALFPRHFAAGRLHSRCILGLSDLPDVFAASVDEQIPDAAHVAVVEHGGPELGGQDQTGPAVGETPQVQVPLQVQDLVLPAGGERSPAAVYRDDTWRKKQKHY